MRLDNSNITDAKTNKLCNALEKNTHALSLDLSNNNLGDAGAKALCAVLSTGAAPDLIDLCLRDNPIGEEGLKAIKDLEKSRKSLKIVTGMTPPPTPIPPFGASKGPSPVMPAPGDSNSTATGSSNAYSANNNNNNSNKSLGDSAIVKKYFQVGNDENDEVDDEVEDMEGEGGIDPEQLSALLWDKVSHNIVNK